jgi:hypothetical protein
MVYQQQHIPLPDALRLFLAQQVDRHLTPRELLAAPGGLKFVRLLHEDACSRCAGRHKRMLAHAARQQRAS